MNQGGNNGTVTRCAVAPSGARSATVSFPGDPSVQPPVEPYEDTYLNLTDDQYDTLLAGFTGAAQSPPSKVDTTVDGSGNCTGVAVHR